MNIRLKYLFLTLITLILLGIGILLIEMRSRQVETTAKIHFINNYCLE